MYILSYQIKLLQPVLATSLEGDPNSSVSFDYLPGSALRGALIAKYLARGNPFDNALFIQGDACFLNGYPVGPSGQRSLPQPASWRCQKDKSKQIYDFAITSHPDKTGWVGVDGRFCVVGKGMPPPTVDVVKTDRSMAVHTTRNRDYGRARAKTNVDDNLFAGAVYRFEALAARQRFAAHILCRNEAAADALEPLLAGEINIGKAISTHYGLAAFTNCSRITDTDSWQETGLAPDWETGQLTITFLSDTLCRNQWGQFTADADTIQAYFESQLNCSLQRRETNLFLQSNLVGGFNKTWGLPLPQTMSVGMGSVIAFDMPQGEMCQTIQEKLGQLMAVGVGERRVEGFGRIAVNWQAHPQLSLLDKGSKETSAWNDEEPGFQSQPIIHKMVTRLWQQQLDKRLIAEANTLGATIGSVQPSQLHRLRHMIRKALSQEPEAGRQQLLNYIEESLQGRNITRRQFAKARIEIVGEDGKVRVPLLKWLKKQIKQDQLTWATAITENPPTIGPVRAEVTAQMVYENNLRFLDATLARAAKVAGGRNS